MNRIVLYFIFSFFIVLSQTILSQSGGIELQYLSTYQTGIFDQGAAEIVAYDPVTERLFFVNGGSTTIEVLNISDPTNPAFVQSLDMTLYGGSANSVAVKNGIVAVALEDTILQANGRVLFFDAAGTFLNEVTAGALPDMIIFTPDGSKVLTANEGEPNADYDVDPVGSVSIIDISGGIATLTQGNVQNVDFSVLNGATLDTSIRIFGPNATVAQDLEPEYIAISADSKTAWVTCQENNALMIIDIDKAEILDLLGLGFKDHNQPGFGLDASDQDGAINIATWPVKGMYLPDAISSFVYNGETYLITANEGDVREYDGYEEAERMNNITLDSVVFPDFATLQLNSNLGRLNITTSLGDTDNDGAFEELYSFGTRSFTIWDSAGTLVYDSGDEFEQVTASVYPANFNASSTSNSFDNRSDDKGPEPEATLIVELKDSIYAFIGLERIGGIFVYNITNPNSPVLIQYINNRDFSGSPSGGTAKDLGVENTIFIDSSDSPNGLHLLVAANEVSGTVTIFTVEEVVIPVELISFAANSINGGIELTWTTATEINNLGFEIERQEGSKQSINWKKIGYAAGYGTTTETKAYSFTDNDVATGTYSYRLKQIDFDGSYEYSKVIEVDFATVYDFNLSQNYPNPFNPSTNIAFQIADFSFVSLKVYDVLGREVAILINEEKESGKYEIEFNSYNLSSGLYFYTLKADNNINTKKMILIK